MQKFVVAACHDAVHTSGIFLAIHATAHLTTGCACHASGANSWITQTQCMTAASARHYHAQLDVCVTNHMVVLLQAGTYIKEFVHSDAGRTQPHLAGLLGLSTPAVIIQLDVNQIHMDFLV